MFGNISRNESMIKSCGKILNGIVAYLLKMNFTRDVLLKVFRAVGFRNCRGWLFQRHALLCLILVAVIAMQGRSI